MGGLFVYNNQQKDGESFQDADIVEIFAAPTSLATTISTPKSTVSSTLNPNLSKTPWILFSPSATVPQSLQDSDGQAEKSPIIPSLSTIPKLSVSPSSSRIPTPIPTQLPTATPSLTPMPTQSQSSHISPSSTSTPTPESTLIPSETPNNTNSASAILINEVQIGGQDAGDEFIELYNPTSLEIDISSWSIQYLTGSTGDITKTVKKNFEAGNAISAKSFFLIARAKNSSGADGYTGSMAPDLDHRSFSLSGASTGGKIYLVNDEVKIDSLIDSNIIDMIDYSFLVPENGQSLERKSDGNFELNNNPNPQNTNSQ